MFKLIRFSSYLTLLKWLQADTINKSPAWDENKNNKKKTNNVYI